MILPSPHLPTLLFHWLPFHCTVSDSSELEQWTGEGEKQEQFSLVLVGAFWILWRPSTISVDLLPQFP